MARRRQPIEQYLEIDGGALCYFEWGEPRSEMPSVLFAHATGFHARVWDATIDALPTATHVISVDQRGHGRSLKKGPYSWEQFGVDLIALIDHLSLPRLVGVGHSMGGHGMVQAAAARTRAFERLVLVDPVIMDPDLYGQDRVFTLKPIEHPTSKRKNQWASWREMYERLHDRGTFALWRRDVLEDYCRYGVLPNPDGPGFVLACPPLVEATIYTGSAGRDVSALFARVEVPVTVLRAERREGARTDVMDFARSPTWPALAAQFAHGTDVYLPELTHFIPMQDPELVARFVAQDRGQGGPTEPASQR